MIAGIGTDIVAVVRLERALERHGERFAQRILAPTELLNFREGGATAAFLARRFAAKEAASKALGTGFSDGVTLRDLEVVHDVRGQPSLRFHGAAAERAVALGVSEAALSLSDEREYAVAFVILVTG
ncbi:holo-ACP synthase [Halorhodospira halophila]|uniref:Holo-[acyl-carrier-protein] synthase n=1 Tax=Halorhodospira halophila (strain DSM 244 / SL1) TaxID=349124 RepID=ACPS_HALHL|nr:holo-ACP synthase [Halorhodospira halophila]A1WT13.1 RecName: Full=Holo-[acyl-carrier-protein] synthase; Short=Holo-ACP synthase; AltName: Full=4'-phosphopantetheinyl transferase AcpS [Halorhodospira halophila SL1]ABM60825.1 holo-acyl-carrier-protein synthase [Halorhodospira halophila SL1]MBK1728480.1 holo-ACP synthase [Halorhodospira halophila]